MKLLWIKHRVRLQSYSQQMLTICLSRSKTTNETIVPAFGLHVNVQRYETRQQTRCVHVKRFQWHTDELRTTLQHKNLKSFPDFVAEEVAERLIKIPGKRKKICLFSYRLKKLGIITPIWYYKSGMKGFNSLPGIKEATKKERCIKRFSLNICFHRVSRLV